MATNKRDHVRNAVETSIVVPWPPTAEMITAAESAFMPFGDMELAIQCAILEARRPVAQNANQSAHDTCPHCGGGGIDERTGSLCE